MQKMRQEVRSAKEDYQSAINRRSASQREVNELLQRKHAWSSTDLERFTQLYRSDHTNEQAEAHAQERLAQAERTADEAQAQLARSILARYHEEQIWSDKIRRASTWGTWGLVGFNVLLFIVVQLGLEPWKRKRLVAGFEEKVREVIVAENIKYSLMQAAAPAAVAAAVAEVAPTPEVEAAAEEAAAPVEPEVPVEEEAPVEVLEEEPAAEEVEEAAAVPEQGRPQPHEVLRMVEAKAQKSLDFVKERTKHFLSDDEIVLSQVERTKIVVGSAAAGSVLTALVAAILVNNKRS